MRISPLRLALNFSPCSCSGKTGGRRLCRSTANSAHDFVNAECGNKCQEQARFETRDDLQAAPSVIDSLLSIPWYKHLAMVLSSKPLVYLHDLR